MWKCKYITANWIALSEEMLYSEFAIKFLTLLRYLKKKKYSLEVSFEFSLEYALCLKQSHIVPYCTFT